MPADDAQQQYVSAPEAARILGVSIFTVQRWAKAGRIPGTFKVGNRWHFRLDTLRSLDQVMPPPDAD